MGDTSQKTNLSGFKEQNELLKRSDELYANIQNRFSEILQSNQTQLFVQRNLIVQQIKSLQKESQSLGVNNSLVNAKLKILKSEAIILKQRELGNAINVKMLKQYESALNYKKELIKQEEKSLKLEDVLRKMGLGRVVDAAELLKTYGKQKAFFIALLISIGLQIRALFRDFRAIDSAAAEFRKTMGLLRGDSEKLEKITRNITFNYAHLGVTANDVYKVMTAIASSVGSARYITEKMVGDMTLLSVQLGVAETTSAEFLRIMGQIANNTMSSQKDIALFTSALSAAAGTNLNEVMGDVAAASKSGYQFLSRDPLVLAKAAVEARLMGTNLESATKTASSLLNFTQSVKDEMEASVLVGKSINLQKARELAYHRDIRGLNAEILNIMKQTNFENLDPFQQDAVARALGKSVDELAKMAQSEREMNAIKNSNDALTKSQFNEYNRLLNINKQMLGTEADKRREQAMAMANAEALKTISLAFHAILQRVLTHTLVPIANLINLIAKGFNKFNMWAGAWAGWLGIVINLLDDIAVWFLSFKVLKWMSSFSKITEIGFIKFNKLISGSFGLIGNLFKNIGLKILNVFNVGKFLTFFSKMGGGIVKILGPLSKVLGIVGWIITAFSVGFGIGKWLNKFKWVQNAAQAIWLGIFKIGDGISAVGSMIYDNLISPFKRVWSWLKKTFLGSSPSELGLMIVEGIIAVGGLIMDALISPFTKAWNFIKGLPIISHLFGSKDIANNIVPDINPTMTVEKTKPAVDVNKKSSGTISDAVGGMSDELIKKMSLMVDAINSLRDDMKNGSLTANVFIDSQKLDSALGRRLAYTGTLT